MKIAKKILGSLGINVSTLPRIKTILVRGGKRQDFVTKAECVDTTNGSNVEKELIGLKSKIDGATKIGKNNRGTWIKYSNGIIEQFMKIETSKGYSEAYGNLYKIPEKQVSLLPLPVIENLYSNASANFGGIAIVANVEFTKESISCVVMNATKSDDGQYTTKTNFYSIGTWKQKEDI